MSWPALSAQAALQFELARTHWQLEQAQRELEELHLLLVAALILRDAASREWLVAAAEAQAETCVPDADGLVRRVAA